MNDMVNRPDHYNQGAVECRTIARHMDFDMGNAFKYIWRHPAKNGGTIDLDKAENYLIDWENEETTHFRDFSLRTNFPWPEDVIEAFAEMISTTQFPIQKIIALMMIFDSFWNLDATMLGYVHNYIESETAKHDASA